MSRLQSLRHNPALAQARDRAEVDQWNRLQPVGAKVTVRLDSGVPFETTTTSQASVQGGRVVVRVNGFGHAWPLNRVHPGWDDHLAVGPL